MFDLLYSLRRLLASPGTTALAVLSLALAIGANSAVFSYVDQVLLRRPAFRDPDRLVMVYERDLTSKTPSDVPGNPPPGVKLVSVPDLMDYRAQNRVFEHLVGLGPWRPTLSGDPESIRIRAAGVSAELFKTLGVRPILGRDFLPQEDNPDHDKVAILGYGLWQDRFGKAPDVLGKTVRIDGKVYQVIGVMPKGFDYPEETMLWKPLGFAAKDWDRDFGLLRIVARLRPGVSLAAAQQNLDSVAHGLAELYPTTNRQRGAWVESLNDYMVAQLRPALHVLWGAVALVLLIACANVANLTLSRALARQGEIAIRTALGAGRRQLTRLLLAEGLLIGMASGALGLLLAWWGVRAMAPLLEEKLPELSHVTVDLQVVAFTLGLSLLTAVLSTLAPVLRASRPDLTSALKSGGQLRATRSHQRLQRLAVMVQVALAFALLTGAGLLLKSVAHLLAVDPGFHAADALTVEITLSPRAAYAQQAKTIGFWRELESRVQGLPGVSAVGCTWNVPMAAKGGSVALAVEGRTPEPGATKGGASVEAVTPGYFAAMGLPLRRGRVFTAHDDAPAPPVVIVNEQLARELLPGEDLLGKRIVFDVDFGPAGQLEKAARTVVGIVGDVRRTGLDREVSSELYFPNYQGTWRWSTLVVRAPHPESLAAPIRRFIRDLDPNLALGRVRTLQQVIDTSVAQQRLSAWLLTAFAAIALALAGAGIYGIVAYLVRRQTAEIGIRMALGAPRSRVLWLILAQAVWLAVVGIAIGLVLASGLTRTISGQLFGVSRLDTATFVLGALALIAIAALAGYVPALRATRIDPVRAIRTE